ncbi:MAG: hypothetical protein QM736_29765 [Vicinamibacterales bacterium]
MRRFQVWVLASICAFANSAPAAAQAPRTVTVTGQIIDLVCYARNNANVGMDHDDGRVCAMACVKWEGNPVGIVTTDGKVYQFTGGIVANNNTKIAPYVAKTVTVTGTVSEKDGMAMLSASDVTLAK